jgi:glycosyltransferase involved in cell wall biosynthesis
MHNALPHDSKWPDEDLQVRRLMVERADVVHVMNDHSLRLAQEIYPFAPEKSLIVGHPLYTGAYPQTLSDAEARARLGIGHSDFVAVIFGAIEPYKGVEDACHAFAEFASTVASRGGRRARLMVVGKVASAALETRLREISLQHDSVELYPGVADSGDVQMYFSASDVVLCGHKEALNSGAVLLAFTFNRRVIGPRIGAFPELISQERGRLYGGDRCDSLQAACEAEYYEVASRKSVLDSLGCRFEPSAISGQFFTGLRRLLESDEDGSSRLHTTQ